ncbi:TAXI family TRAP transporter solute-binding subunit [Aestuariispira insulae]|uniref:TRAP transporter TAXI family solute receptor n=1 Tax=Aestuariispira insulae TaxID=1461337 RepID=A0A3D9HYH3_9PROT|nr:TAXI family TRAP transporter solute-binding subunit [Aestuariispira insulae]RED53956.1 hypothetical protein DFP90_101755 [Aestuariispira insulae]
MKQSIRIALLSLFMTIAGQTGQALAGEPRLTFFRIGAGPTTETLYALSTAISAGISRPPGSLPCNEGGVCGVPGLIAVAQSRSGSIDNLFAMMRGELESALVRADVAFQAYHGGGPFKYEGAQENLRVIANLTPVSLHIVVPAGSDINSVRDLRGKRISVGARGSGTRDLSLIVLRTNSLAPRDLSLRYMKPGPASDALYRGDLDALFLVGAAPVDAIADLAERMELRLLPLEGYPRRQLFSLFPFIETDAIIGGTYEGIKETQTVKMGVQWVVWQDTDETLIEQITQALWQSDTSALFNRNNPRHTFPDPRYGVPEKSIPMHPGATRYYQQAGLLAP